MIEFAIINAGWRTEFFLRIARACPERFKAVGVLARNRDKAAYVERDCGVRLFGDWMSKPPVPESPATCWPTASTPPSGSTAPLPTSAP